MANSDTERARSKIKDEIIDLIRKAQRPGDIWSVDPNIMRKIKKKLEQLDQLEGLSNEK